MPATSLFDVLPSVPSRIRTGGERHALQSTLLVHLFEPLIDHHRAGVLDMRARNIQFTGDQHRHFMYRATLHPSPHDPGFYDADLARNQAASRAAHGTRFTLSTALLHTDLHEAMDELDAELAQGLAQFDAARTYLATSLSTCTTVTDLEMVLPAFLHPLLARFVNEHPMLFDVGHATLGPGVVAALQAEGAHGIEAMESRFALNLLLGS